jgi:transcriptional regulator with XRE-family HTH domain
MAKRVIQKQTEKTLYLGAWMDIRAKSRVDVADALDRTEAAISRWINQRRTPRKGDIRRLEEFLQVEPGALFRDPLKAPERELLAGLDAEARGEAKRYIAFLHTRKK